MTESLVNLNGKTILITGASSGIGRAIAVLVANLGARGILVARREAPLQHTADMMVTKAACYTADLQNLGDIEDMISRITREQGPLDGFVHSAGLTSTIPLKMLKPKSLAELMTINFYAYIELIRHVSKKGNYHSGMSIVGISSVAAMQGNKGKTAYCASKAAMDAATRCIAKELAPKTIRVNTVAPAIIRTETIDRFMNSLENADALQEVIKRQYLGLGEPSDVAGMVAFLLSPAARYITGSTLLMDGGRLTS